MKKRSPITVPERLDILRKLMKERGCDAYWVPSTDPHMSEYLPACWQRRQFISGFTGSAGEVVVMAGGGAGLWTDSRYFLAAAEQLEGTGIDLFRMGRPDVPSMESWVADNLKRGQKLGVDPRLLSIDAAKRMEKKLTPRGVKLFYLEENLVDIIWTDGPGPSRAAPRVLPLKYTGMSVAAKLDLVRKKMKAVGASAHVVTSLDDIAWLLNMRGKDIEYNPLFISYLSITGEGAHLFMDPAKVNNTVRKHLDGVVELHPYGEIGAYLNGLASRSGKVWLDPKKTNHWVLMGLKGKARTYFDRNPSTNMKSVKSAVELAGMRKAHVQDGVSMVRFLKWLEENVPGGRVTELKAARKCDEFRKGGEGFVGPSFETISGYAEHGAIVHYEVTPGSDVKLEPHGIYLVDSGGQYLYGTTDITRTVALGKPTADEKEMFTRVLKGHIDLAMLKFPEGFSGKQIEIMARKPLWDVGKNYGHGTGHGVGHYLNVHEGPMGITPRDIGVPLAAGNVLSNEPGYYREGHYGIRVENVVVVVNERKLSTDMNFLGFDTITMCPIDRSLVDTSIMTPEELAWLNRYHREVFNTLSVLLKPSEVKWLKKRTRALRKR